MDPAEVLKLHEVSVKEFQMLVATGEVKHGAGLAAWARWMSRDGISAGENAMNTIDFMKGITFAPFHKRGSLSTETARKRNSSWTQANSEL